MNSDKATTDHVVQRHRDFGTALRWVTIAAVLGIAGATLWTSLQSATLEAARESVIAGGPAAYSDTSAVGPVEPALGAPTPRPRIVELYQDHCPACERTKVQVERLRSDCAGRHVEILSINADDSRNAGLLEHLDINMVPTFILLTHEGREAGRLVGAPELAQLRQAAASLMDQSCAGEAPTDEATDDSVVGSGCQDSTTAEPWDEHEPHPLDPPDESCQS